MARRHLLSFTRLTSLGGGNPSSEALLPDNECGQAFVHRYRSLPLLPEDGDARVDGAGLEAVPRSKFATCSRVCSYLLPSTATSPQRRGSLPWVLVRTLATLFLIAALATPLCLCLFLSSDARQLRLAASRATCIPPTFAWFPEIRGHSYYTSQEWFIPGVTTARVSSRPSNDTTTTQPSVGIVQVCTHPFAGSRYLRQLLSNHQWYAKRYKLEYMLYTGEEGGSSYRGVWHKIEALRHKVEQELLKPDGERLEWIFYHDIDTLFYNVHVALQDFLPPSDNPTPFVIAHADRNGLNAGVFFLRVDSRSVAFLSNVLAYPSKHHWRRLQYAEQTAMALVADEQGLVEKGEFVYLPSHSFNDYSADSSFAKDTSKAFLYHFASPDAKRDTMLPLLDALVDRTGQPRGLDESALPRSRDEIVRDVREFWKEWDETHTM